MLLAPRVVITGTVNLGGGAGGYCSGSSGYASAGSSGNLWIRANEVVISGTINATHIRIDALDVTSSSEFGAGPPDGIPAAIEYYQASTGAVHVTNNSSDTVSVTLTR